eukprot:NODE_25041_length_601_cov_7.348101.p4 GENE.NODE_25041_length_601_cov_7.348101~~NODE_25041_length_601_cov_7.348101.p4  ORF type:complete len:76 (+),score=45.48 NODE_25041_length_601_cov_7.348101:319-546(+)
MPPQDELAVSEAGSPVCGIAGGSMRRASELVGVWASWKKEKKKKKKKKKKQNKKTKKQKKNNNKKNKNKKNLSRE